MQIEDYEQVYALWLTISGFAIRSVDDSKEGVERFLQRNPGISVVAEEDGKIVGAILCGHDGRRGCLYHVCVDPAYRRRGIGKDMVVHCMNALHKEPIKRFAPICPIPGQSVRAMLQIRSSLFIPPQITQIHTD